jgi:hypothetical protein
MVDQKDGLCTASTGKSHVVGMLQVKRGDPEALVDGGGCNDGLGESCKGISG